jgi:hypothetical protein
VTSLVATLFWVKLYCKNLKIPIAIKIDSAGLSISANYEKALKITKRATKKALKNH